MSSQLVISLELAIIFRAGLPTHGCIGTFPAVGNESCSLSNRHIFELHSGQQAYQGAEAWHPRRAPGLHTTATSPCPSFWTSYRPGEHLQVLWTTCIHKETIEIIISAERSTYLGCFITFELECTVLNVSLVVSCLQISLTTRFQFFTISVKFTELELI